jgi:hypothetical protein
MPNRSGAYRLIGTCSLLIAVIAIHLYYLMENDDVQRGQIGEDEELGDRDEGR